MHLLIVAAGSGSRMGGDRNKLLMPLAGRPLLAWTIDAVMQADLISWVGVVGQPIDQDEIMEIVAESPKPVAWIQGGASRQESVQRGLAAMPLSVEHVIIHDGARCLVEPSLIDACAKAVSEGEAVIAATPVTDTIKRVNVQGVISSTPERKELWAAQTPQGFSLDALKRGHSEANRKGWSVTDDASLFERLGWPVRVLESSPSNIKVTTPFDLIVAESVIAKRGSS